MNGNERSIPQDFDPAAAPDLSRDDWPEKFAKATVRRGRPPVAKPEVSTTIKAAGRGWQTRTDKAAPQVERET